MLRRSGQEFDVNACRAETGARSSLVMTGQPRRRTVSAACAAAISPRK
jgi:hypothetical protein